MIDIKRALEALDWLLSSPDTASAARTTIRGFTQSRKISLRDVLLFYVFRSAETTNKDMALYFSKLEKPNVSKQAMFKALNKLNPDVFPFIIHSFAKEFYMHQEYHTLDDYLILACDGSVLDLPNSSELRGYYGGVTNMYIKDNSQVKKPQAKCSILVDVLNHVILDSVIAPYKTSELPMLFEHLKNCEEVLQGKKIILLCDRYYGSADLFLYNALRDYKFIVRGKTNFYKEYVNSIERDGIIEVPFNRAWIKRLKYEDNRAYAERVGALSLRVIRNTYEYTLTDGKATTPPTVTDSIYFTNLESDSFSTERILELYHVQRWDNETVYFDIKNHLEAERFNSTKYNIVTNEIYGKILCFSVCGLFYEAACEDSKENSHIREPSNKYEYIPNMKNITDTLRAEHRFLKLLSDFKMYEREIMPAEYLSSLVRDFAKTKVPVRPGRHYRRWGRWMTWIPTAKFRVDGRRNPPIKKLYNGPGYLTTQR